MMQQLIYLSLWMCLIALMGCESQKEMADPKAALEKLAEQYWTKRLVDKDYRFTYNLELEKESLPFSEYLKRVQNAGNFKVLSVKTEEVRIDKDRAEVFLIAQYNLPMLPKDASITLQDLWLLRSNEWKHKLPGK